MNRAPASCPAPTPCRGDPPTFEHRAGAGPLGNASGPIAPCTDVVHGTPAVHDGPGILPSPSPPIPVTWFARLHNALQEQDFALARRALRELRMAGYSVLVLDKRGGRP
jgi:hypothetical protein